MGVRGLQTYMQKNNETFEINLKTEIAKWKKKNNGSPILVIDLMGLLPTVCKCKQEDILCGGRHHHYFDLFENFFQELSTAGASLVFFSDLNVQNTKIDEWIKRRDNEYDLSINIYDQIYSGKPLRAIVEELGANDRKSLTSILGCLRSTARKYGKFFYSTERECDLEVAQYARDSGALAVIATDSDFLIFSGRWRYWSASDINLETFDSIEYNRDALSTRLKLSIKERAIFSTLFGNDYTGKYYDELCNFHHSKGPLKFKFENVARYIRDILRRCPTEEHVVRKVICDVFGSKQPENIFQLITDSFHSYDLNFTRTEIKDPLLQKCVHHSGLYNHLSDSHIKTIALTMYDMRRKDIVKCFTENSLELLKRILGILWQHKHDKTRTFTLIAKHSHEEGYKCTIEKPIYPNLQVPPLIELIFDEDNDTLSTLNQFRYKLLEWLLPIPSAKFDIIQLLPKTHFLPVLTLLYLVQEQQITVTEADGILLTEMIVRGEHRNIDRVSYPIKLNARSVHVAHLYVKTYSNISLALTVAGFLNFVDKKLLFDGVAYHLTMDSINLVTPDDLIQEISQYRIYV